MFGSALRLSRVIHDIRWPQGGDQLRPTMPTAEQYPRPRFLSTFYVGSEAGVRTHVGKGGLGVAILLGPESCLCVDVDSFVYSISVKNERQARTKTNQRKTRTTFDNFLKSASQLPNYTPFYDKRQTMTDSKRC